MLLVIETAEEKYVFANFLPLPEKLFFKKNIYYYNFDIFDYINDNELINELLSLFDLVPVSKPVPISEINDHFSFLKEYGLLFDVSERFNNLINKTPNCLKLTIKNKRQL